MVKKNSIFITANEVKFVITDFKNDINKSIKIFEENYDFFSDVKWQARHVMQPTVCFF